MLCKILIDKLLPDREIFGIPHLFHYGNGIFLFPSLSQDTIQHDERTGAIIGLAMNFSLAPAELIVIRPSSSLPGVPKDDPHRPQASAGPAGRRTSASR